MLSLLALLLLGAVAAAGSGVGIGTATARSDPTSLTYTVAVTLFGLFAVGCMLLIIVSLFQRRVARRDGDLPGHRTSRSAAVLPVILLLGLTLLIASRRQSRRPAAPRLGLGPSHVHTVAHSTVAFVPAASLSTVAAVLVLLALVVVRSRVSGRRHLPLSHLERGAEGLEWPPSEPGSLARSLAEVSVPDPEKEPDPRRAVVAAYLAMTRAAAEAGAIRRIDETPAEFLERLLDAAGASAGAARQLTSLFELARYSSRFVDESLRTSAIDALHRLQAELGAPV